MSGICSPIYKPVCAPVVTPLWPGWEDVVNYAHYTDQENYTDTENYED